VLEVQQAQRGIDAPPSVILEIQDIRTAVEELRKQIRDSDKNTDFLIRQIVEN
jgi:hypothetical protein